MKNGRSAKMRPRKKAVEHKNYSILAVTHWTPNLTRNKSQKLFSSAESY